MRGMIEYHDCIDYLRGNTKKYKKDIDTFWDKVSKMDIDIQEQPSTPTQDTPINTNLEYILEDGTLLSKVIGDYANTPINNVLDFTEEVVKEVSSSKLKSLPVNQDSFKLKTQMTKFVSNILPLTTIHDLIPEYLISSPQQTKVKCGEGLNDLLAHFEGKIPNKVVAEGMFIAVSDILFQFSQGCKINQGISEGYLVIYVVSPLLKGILVGFPQNTNFVWGELSSIASAWRRNREGGEGNNEEEERRQIDQKTDMIGSMQIMSSFY